jgi:hypothetical protein
MLSISRLTKIVQHEILLRSLLFMQDGLDKAKKPFHATSTVPLNTLSRFSPSIKQIQSEVWILCKRSHIFLYMKSIFFRFP